MRPRPSEIKGLIVFGSLLLVFLSACSGGRSSRTPAETVVLRHFMAAAQQNMDVLMDTIEPTDRNQSGLFLLGLINASSLSVGISPIDFGIDLGDLTAISYKNLAVSTVTQEAAHALIRAEGDLRYTSLGLEVPFCDMLDVNLGEDGQWYIDLNGPDRMQRLDQVLANRELQLQDLLERDPGTTGNLFGDVMQGFTEGMAIALNLCP